MTRKQPRSIIPREENSVEEYDARDITNGNAHKIERTNFTLDKHFWGGSGPLITPAYTCGLMTAATSFFFYYLLNFGWYAILPASVSFVCFSLLAIGYFMTKRNKKRRLAEPLNHIELALAELIDAYNQKVKALKILENGERLGLPALDEKEALRAELFSMRKKIDGYVEKFRAVRSTRKEMSELKEKSRPPLLTSGTTELDVITAGTMLAQERAIDELETDLAVDVCALRNALEI